MIKIKSISNEDEIHYYTLEISPNIHNELISFFDELEFSKDELTKIDTLFPELDGSCFHIKKEDMKVYLFICKENMNMVIDSELSQKKLSKIMSKYFTFPK